MFTAISGVRMPTQLGQSPERANRRLYDEEKEYNEYLKNIRHTGYAFLKPPGVKKTMAVLAQTQEAQEPSNASRSQISEYNQGFMLQIPDASVNHSLGLDEYRSSVASWQTFDDTDSMLPPRSDPPGLPRSPVLNFALSREPEEFNQSIYNDSMIEIHQDSSFR